MKKYRLDFQKASDLLAINQSRYYNTSNPIKKAQLKTKIDLLSNEKLRLKGEIGMLNQVAFAHQLQNKNNKLIIKNLNKR